MNSNAILTSTYGNVRTAGVSGVSDDEAMAQLVDAYRLRNLVDSDGSDSDSEAGSVISECESAEEDRDQVTVDTDSFERIREQLDGNVAENPDYELERVRGFACGCSSFDGGPCCRQFTDEEISDSRMNLKEMSVGKLLLLFTVCCCLRLSLPQSHYSNGNYFNNDIQWQ